MILRIAQRRHAEHYVQVLHEADALYLQGGEAAKSGLQLFDAEWGNIQMAYDWASRHAQVDEAAAECCLNFPGVGTYLLDLLQFPQERIRWLETALALARSIGNREATAYLDNLGAAYAKLGQWNFALTHTQEALAIFEEIEDPRAASLHDSLTTWQAQIATKLHTNDEASIGE